MARIWDAFLTEQDRAYVARQPKAPVGLGEKVAILMVDNYRAALGDKAEPLLQALEKWPMSTGLAGWRALEKIERLLAAGRAARLPIVHVTFLSEQDSGVAPWTALTNYWKEPGTASQHLSGQDWAGQIVEQAAPAAGEAVLRKTAPSAFFGTPLAAHLQALRIDTLIVAGEATSGCVRATVVDAVSYRFRVTVVEDCTYDAYEAAHAMNLFDMHRKYADVVDLDSILKWLESRS